MKNLKLFHLIVLLIISPLLFAANQFSVFNLTCELRNNPVGIDNTKPAFCWQIKSENRGWYQGAYQVLVASSENFLKQNIGDIWDSGKVNSSESTYIIYDGTKLISNSVYYWKVCVWDPNGKQSEWSKTAMWTTGLFNDSEWQAKWISSRYVEAKKGHLQIPESERDLFRQPENPDTAALLLRKQFKTKEVPVRATAFICGLGYYELFINNRKAGDHVLDPNFTDYTVRTNYVTYDVTSLFRSGENVVGVILGNGFYNLPNQDLFQMEKSCWKTAPKLLLKIVLEFSDGTIQNIVSDGTWKWSTGEIVYNCIRGGETIDNRKLKPNWADAGFIDPGWNSVTEVPPPFGKLASQIMPPMRVTETLRATKVWEPKKGVFVFDFGKNITGWPALKIKGASGQVLTLQSNERLLNDSSLNTAYCTSHTYGRFQKDIFILNGGKEEYFEPRFTYHGFRYVQISGLSSKPSIDCMTAKYVHTDIPSGGNFECSDQRINQFNSAVRHTLLDCIHGMPGEEPIREKMGWTQDGQNTMLSYLYNFDAATSYIKYLYDMIDSQESNGHVPPVIPTNGWGYLLTNGKTIYCDDPWWGGTLAIVADNLYTYCGDIRLIQVAYTPMKRYVDFLSNTSENYSITWSLGDWVDKAWGANGPGLTSVEFTSTIAYFYLSKLLSNHAKLLGISSDVTKYALLAEQIKTGFNKKFLDTKTGKYERGSQTAQGLALFTGIVPNDYLNLVENKLLEDVGNNDFHVTSGFIGVMPVMNYIAEKLDYQTAYKMLSQEEGDGWLYMVKDENSTLGESLYPKKEVGNLHHPFSTCAGSWLYAYLAGIRPDDKHPGFNHFIIKPSMVNEISWVKADYKSIYGKIESAWEIKNGQIIMTTTIPPNTTGIIYVPTSDASAITESGKPVSKNSDVKFLYTEKNYSVFESGSGSYIFTATK